MRSGNRGLYGTNSRSGRSRRASWDSSFRASMPSTRNTSSSPQPSTRWMKRFRSESRVVRHELEIGPVEAGKLGQLVQGEHAVDQEHLVVAAAEHALDEALPI